MILDKPETSKPNRVSPWRFTIGHMPNNTQKNDEKDK